jgi:PAS domain S-box-containing protein
MLVDDEAIITTQLEKRLSSMGYEVVGVASSGEESVNMARELKPDIVLMDIVMPGKVDGIDAASKIRAELDIPIIFLTAFADKEHINRAKSADPFGYIVKPFHEEEIQASIEVALHKRTGERRLRENERLYHTIMYEAFDPIIITDEKGRILEVNKRAEDLLGCRRKKLLGAGLEQYLVPGRKKRLKRMSPGGGASSIREGKVRTAEGTELRVNLSVSSVSYNGQGALLQILSEAETKRSDGMKMKRLFQSRYLRNRQTQTGVKTATDSTAGADYRYGSDEEIVPICGSCKKIRASSTQWINFESFFQDVYGIDFSHGICSECAHKLWPDMPPESEERAGFQGTAQDV